jgi:hypothetical protein
MQVRFCWPHRIRAGKLTAIGSPNYAPGFCSLLPLPEGTMEPMTRRYGIPILALLLGAACLVVLNQAPIEPRYEGRPLSAWMDGGSEPAALALHGVGLKAVPFLLAKIRWEHPRWGYRERYRALFHGVPACVRGFLPRPKAAAFDEERACSAFLEIGPSAVPALVEATNDHNAGVRAASVFALRVFRQNGCHLPLNRPARTRMTVGE